MAGRRAPEMAGGQASIILASISKLQSTALLSLCTNAALSQETTTNLLNDFHLGLARLRSVFEQKFMMWEQLPWMLTGLAHHNGAVARHCAAQAVWLFEVATAAAPHAASLHHRVTLRFLAHGTPLRREVDAFVAGGARRSLPLLMEAVAPFAFISIVERRIEARHAQMHRSIALRSTGGPYTSLALRMDEIRRIASDPGDRKELELAIQKVRNPKAATRIFNLHMHPDLRPLRGIRKENKLEAALGKVIYSRGLSCDLVSRRTPCGLGMCVCSWWMG